MCHEHFSCISEAGTCFLSFKIKDNFVINKSPWHKFLTVFKHRIMSHTRTNWHEFVKCHRQWNLWPFYFSMTFLRHFRNSLYPGIPTPNYKTTQRYEIHTQEPHTPFPPPLPPYEEPFYYIADVFTNACACACVCTLPPHPHTHT